MSNDELDVELEQGDFLYQADQEIFLAVMGETDEGYRFAVHGWREINNDRLDRYISGTHGKLHTEDELESIMEEKADSETLEHFDQLKDLFEVYETDSDDDGPHTDFAMEDN